MKRYSAYIWLLSDVILIDRKEKTYTFYDSNLHGQIYNLEEKPKKVSNQKLNGLIKRLNKYYDPMEEFVIDKFIFEIMTEYQKEKCRTKLNLKCEENISNGEDKKEVLKDICKFIFEKSYKFEGKEAEFIKYKKYYKNKIEEVV